MAGEPKQKGKTLSTIVVDTILEAANNEYISINHVRITASSNTEVSLLIYDATVGAYFSLLYSKPIEASNSLDLYVHALEPGDRLVGTSSASGTVIVVQYDSTASGSGGSCPVNNLPYALAMNGYVTDSYDKTDSTERYEFATDIALGWISLGTTRQSGTGFGSETHAYTVTGNIDGTRNYEQANWDAPSRKYDYATLLVANTTALGVNRLYTSSFYNKDNAYIMGGGNATYSSSGGTTDTRKWVFATDTLAVLSSTWSDGRTRGAATSNLTYGIYTGGVLASTSNTTETSQKLTFATDTWSSGGSLSTAKDFHNAFSNSDYGIFTGGYETTTSKYTFATDTTASSTALPNDAALAAATSNPVFGLVMGGEPNNGDMLKDVNKFDFATDTWSAGTSLAMARGYGYGVSSTPGHFA